MRFRFLTIISALFVASLCSAMPQGTPTADEVIKQMAARDAQRQTSLDGYAGMRRYILVNDHMHKRAEMVVRVSGEANGTKHFEIVSESGWKAAHKHVLHKMLESEAETSSPEARAKTRLSPDNYEFQLVGTDKVNDRTVYAINVTPKRKEKYLFHGQILVDAEEYAVVRADGNPAKNPSFWTKSVHFVHTYQKSGEFWFPLTTQSETEARIFGTTDLIIEYFDYKPNGPTTAASSTEIAQGGTRR